MKRRDFLKTAGLGLVALSAPVTMAKTVLTTPKIGNTPKLVPQPEVFQELTPDKLLPIIKKRIEEACQCLLFEPNDLQTREQFKRIVQAVLSEFQSQQQIIRWRIKCDDENNPPDVVAVGQIKCLIHYWKPREIMERSFTVTLGGMGKSFDDFQQSLMGSYACNLPSKLIPARLHEQIMEMELLGMEAGLIYYVKPLPSKDGICEWQVDSVTAYKKNDIWWVS